MRENCDKCGVKEDELVSMEKRQMSDYPLCSADGGRINIPSRVLLDYRRKRKLIIKTPNTTEIWHNPRNTNTETIQYWAKKHPELEPNLVSFNGEIWRFVSGGDISG